MSTIRSPFSSMLITSNFSLLHIVCHQFFPWTVLGDVDLCFSLNSNAADKKAKWAMYLYHQHNQSIHLTDGVVMMSLFASLLQKCSHWSFMPNHINRRFLHKLERHCKFSSHFKAKLRKKKSYKKGPACTFIPSSQEIQRSPRVRKHATACRAIWWIHPSCLSCVIMASIHGNPVCP